MYNVVAERIDAYTGKPKQERSFRATSFECRPALTGGSVAKLWLVDGQQIEIPVSSKPTDFQYVIVYDLNGDVVQYMKVGIGTVGVHLGPVLDRS